jgi:hypothetical protein
MKCFRYKLEHDYGFAPNPFHGFLTLATCKGDIRKNKNLEINDWIIGLGSVAMHNLNHLIFAMQVEEKLTFDQYWSDQRFDVKKPELCGSLVQLYGDNVYHTDERGVFIQENCAHSLQDGTTNRDHYQRDINGHFVLISQRFYYFGDNAPLIPPEFANIYRVGRSLKYKDLQNEDEIRAFINWISSNYSYGIHGDSCNWKEYSLPEMEIFEYE